MTWRAWREVGRTAGGAFITYVAILMAVGLAVYALDPSGYHPTFRDKYLAHLKTLISHSVTGAIALGVGPLLFWASLRVRWRRLHRVLGRIYLVTVVVAALSGFFLGTIAFGGPVPQVAFCLQSIAWLFTAGKAYAAARAWRIDQHRAWMVRNYAVTFSAVTGCLAGYNLQLLGGYEFATIYPWVCWSSWTVNLLLAELFLRAEQRAVQHAVAP